MDIDTNKQSVNFTMNLIELSMFLIHQWIFFSANIVTSGDLIVLNMNCYNINRIQEYATRPIHHL